MPGAPYPTASTVSQSAVLLPPEVMPTQPIYMENASRETGGRPALPIVGAAFGEADYAAPTIGIVPIRMNANASVPEQQRPAVAVSDIPVPVPAGKKLTRRGRSRPKSLLVVAPLLIIVVLFVMAGLIYLALPLTATASVTISPQVHVLQQVFTPRLS